MIYSGSSSNQWPVTAAFPLRSANSLCCPYLEWEKSRFHQWGFYAEWDRGGPPILVHTIRAVGTVTKALRALKCGDFVGARGPFGNP
jgi:hypothetical protein